MRRCDDLRARDRSRSDLVTGARDRRGDGLRELDEPGASSRTRRSHAGPPHPCSLVATTTAARGRDTRRASRRCRRRSAARCPARPTCPPLAPCGGWPTRRRRSRTAWRRGAARGGRSRASRGCPLRLRTRAARRRDRRLGARRPRRGTRVRRRRARCATRTSASPRRSARKGPVPSGRSGEKRAGRMATSGHDRARAGACRRRASRTRARPSLPCEERGMSASQPRAPSVRARAIDARTSRASIGRSCAVRMPARSATRRPVRVGSGSDSASAGTTRPPSVMA